MKVELLAYTQRPGEAGNPLAVVEQAACVCYDSTPDLKDFKVAKGCARSGHLSVWEHINFTFKITNVSRSLLAQLTRHRHGSYSVRSQRYCPEDGFVAINPFHDNARLHGKADWYFYLAQNGYVELRELGASPEDARCLLPNACGTELVLTFNARALIEASHLRLCSRAQKEIRELFANMRKAVEPVCPELARLMVPKCESFEVPFCPERQSCGRHKKLKELTTYAPAIPRDQWEDQANNT